MKSAELDIFSQEDAQLFDETVGIKNRYLAPDDVCASDLCYDAAERLIAGLSWEKESIDVGTDVSDNGEGECTDLWLR